MKVLIDKESMPEMAERNYGLKPKLTYNDSQKLIHMYRPIKKSERERFCLLNLYIL